MNFILPTGTRHELTNRPGTPTHRLCDCNHTALRRSCVSHGARAATGHVSRSCLHVIASPAAHPQASPAVAPYTTLGACVLPRPAESMPGLAPPAVAHGKARARLSAGSRSRLPAASAMMDRMSRCREIQERTGAAIAVSMQAKSPARAGLHCCISASFSRHRSR